jgi:hypothetical protein
LAIKANMYPSNLQDEDEGHWVMFQSYPQLFAEATGSPQYNIVLPMGAQSLISTAEAIYGEQEGLSTIITEASRKAAVGIDEYVKSKGTTEGLIAAFAKSNFKGTGESVVEHMGADFLAKNDLLKKGLAGANLAVNPKMSLMYQGPGKFRKFVFEFPMIAKNKGESNTIKEIVKDFRSSTLPGYKKFGVTGDYMPAGGGDERKKGAGTNFFTFPSTWDITFGHNRLNGESGTGSPFKIARSVCNSVIANYAAAGVPFFFHDGEPFEVKLTVSFTETVIITRDLVEKGY